MGSETGVHRFEQHLAEEMESITLARQLAREALIGGGYKGHHEDVLLVVSELITNALVHGHGAPVLRLTCDPERVLIEVGDESAKLPEAREPGPADGWGLHVIRQLCTRWGVSDHPNGGREGGKVVWCELAAHFTPVIPAAQRAGA
jgi:anti-sigma regulatory factor (Ser/Thr protein kinase)